MEYSSGDLFDKCSILQIKKDKGLTVPEYAAIYLEVGKVIMSHNSLAGLYNKLVESNLEQYNLEDLIRVEKDLEKVGKIALLIREYNDRRVAIKNEISKIVGEFEEVKLYKRGNN